MNIILIIHAFACWFMCGLIWLVQVLVYPNFKIVGQNEFQSFHEFHLKRITWIVAPLMVVELGSSIWILFLNQNSIYWANLFSVILIWGQTAFVNIPSHNRLSFDIEKTKLEMVSGNWPRTVIWSTRSFFWIWIIYKIAMGVTL